MNGGLYRSAHAAPDGVSPVAEDGVTLISVDSDITGQEQALPPEELPSGDGGTAGNSAIMAAGSLVSRLIGFASLGRGRMGASSTAFRFGRGGATSR